MLNFWRNKKSHASFEPDNYKEAILNINCELQDGLQTSIHCHCALANSEGGY